MTNTHEVRVAIVYPGDDDVRKQATTDNNRFSALFEAVRDLGVKAEPAVYHPDFWETVYEQLLQVDAVLVWVNPIQDGHDRSVLDRMLRKVADTGIFVSAHPDIIMKMGTKEVLYQTRHMGWGTETYLYNNFADLCEQLPLRLMHGEARVLKQHRGHSGFGVWKVQANSATERITGETLIRVRHAERGSIEQTITLEVFLKECEPYFDGMGKMIDQAYQNRLPEGMIRCYLVHDKVAGFGHQAINALYPAPDGVSPAEAPQPGPRLYHPPDLSDFQDLKRQMEQEWLPELQTLLDIPTEQLPVLWDADFLLGPKNDMGDTFVLCEINVSSVAPYPDSATPHIAQAVLSHAQTAKAQR
jgi:hypothetical protein